jgi:cbb3-type cytochrome oxidase cytochrome c subunit
MKYGPLVFLAALFALSLSWFGFVLVPQVELGRMPQGTNLVTQQLYPQQRPGQAHQGAEVYRANGCFYCHSQQVGQSGTVCNVILLETGTNLPALSAALAKINPGFSESTTNDSLSGLPKSVLEGVDRTMADQAVKKIKDAGAKATLDIVPVGPDIARGWGKRHSVAADYIYDWPVMLGSQRIGPDLANIGVRRADANWQLRHLYDPQSEVTGSTMPSFKYLFEVRKIGRVPSPDALQLTGKSMPEVGYEVVPKPEARELVAYLLSLQSGAPLFEAPLSVPAPPAPSTNSAVAAK